MEGAEPREDGRVSTAVQGEKEGCGGNKNRHNLGFKGIVPLCVPPGRDGRGDFLRNVLGQQNQQVARKRWLVRVHQISGVRCDT